MVQGVRLRGAVRPVPGNSKRFPVRLKGLGVAPGPDPHVSQAVEDFYFVAPIVQAAEKDEGLPVKPEGLVEPFFLSVKDGQPAEGFGRRRRHAGAAEDSERRLEPGHGFTGAVQFF